MRCNEHRQVAQVFGGPVSLLSGLVSLLSDLVSLLSDLVSPLSDLVSPLSDLVSPVSDLVSPLSDLVSPLSDLVSPLASAAAILEREIAATPGDARSAAAAADDENLEVTAADMRIALYDGPRRLGGDVSLALPPRPGCSTITRSGAPWRRCVLRASRWRVVVISDLRPVQARHRVIALAALAAGVFAALAALALSRVVSAEIVRPLARLRAETSESDARAALAKVQRTLHGVSEMVERLLILAMPPDTARDAREAVALSDVIDEVLGSLDDGARARVSLRVDEGAYVRGDATLLRVMAANAIGNALKFAPDDTVEIEVSRAEGDVVLRVSDRGPGVASGDRVRVFEAFYRSDAARAGAASGHGVGLALVAHVARLHGGDARFEDAVTGASLRITLPAWTPGRRSAGGRLSR